MDRRDRRRIAAGVSRVRPDRCGEAVMSESSLLLLAAYLVVLLLLAWPMGLLLARVADAEASVPGLGWLGVVERGLYRLAGIRRGEAMSWPSYALALLV